MEGVIRHSQFKFDISSSTDQESLSLFLGINSRLEFMWYIVNTKFLTCLINLSCCGARKEDSSSQILFYPREYQVSICIIA